MPQENGRPEPEVDDLEFQNENRDRVQARALRKQLQQLAQGGAGSVLQEMAREILSGRVGLSEAMRVPAYAEALGEKVRTFRESWERMTPEEREKQKSEARRFLEVQRQEIERENRESGGRR
ncbi:hypothetical protein [Streptomyces macrosporus]|uniref:Uncharacterized protein n=1 Tax=Streptomyces macrosporus TaxID=44032 RepID=A0ABN3KS46_9ACTN